MNWARHSHSRAKRECGTEREVPTPGSNVGMVFSLSKSEMQFKNQEVQPFSSGSPESPQALLPAWSAWIHRGDGREDGSIGAVPALQKGS